MQIRKFPHVTRPARRLAAASIAVALVAACGQGDDDSIAKVDPKLADLAASSQTLVADAVTYQAPSHQEMAMAINMQMGGMDLNLGDSTTPMIVTDVGDNGNVHSVIDMSSMMQGLGAGAAQVPEMPTFEQWADAEWLYMDIRNMDQAMSQAMADQDTSTDQAKADLMADLMAPGVFKVNLQRLQDETDLGTDYASAASQMTGQSAGLNAYLYDLAAIADQAKPDPDDPNLMRVETTLGAMMERQGTDISDVPLPGGDLVQGDQADVVASVLDAMKDVPVVYVYSTDDKGRVDNLETSMDMSTMMTDLLSTMDTQGSTGLDQMGDMTVAMTMTATVDYDAKPVVTMPTDVTDDRTDAFISFVNEANAAAKTATSAPTATTAPSAATATTAAA